MKLINSMSYIGFGNTAKYSNENMMNKLLKLLNDEISCT